MATDGKGEASGLALCLQELPSGMGQKHVGKEAGRSS